MTRRRRTVILISGRGSNMLSLIEAAAVEGFPAEIVGVISNRPHAPGLARAKALGIPALAIDHTAFLDRRNFEETLDAALATHRAELICMAGFMRVLTPWFIGRWEGRMLNIHPSLLPAFKGLDTHARALAAGVRVHGCTVHYVVPELDSGPVIAQASVPVLPGDTEETLAARVLAEEHRLYPEALALVASGKARLEGGKVVFG